MTEESSLLGETVSRLLQQHCTRQAIELAESGAWPEGLWGQIAGLELGTALVDEAAGGYGLPAADAFGIVRLAGCHALPLPLPETMLANHVLGRAGMTLTGAPTVVVSGRGITLTRQSDRWLVSGKVDRIPWGRRCRVVLLASDGARMLLVPLAAEHYQVAIGHNIAMEPRDTLEIDASLPADTVVAPVGDVNPVWLRAAGAVLRCCQMAGAMERVAELSVAYAQDRVQFGRPIGKFQAIQQSLARLAGETAAARAAADIAVDAFADRMDLSAVAAAKVRAGEAAGIVAAIAHQIHGAMGFTREYGLQALSRRLWSWRDEMGNEAEWSRLLGRRLAVRGGDRLWAEITAI